MNRRAQSKVRHERKRAEKRRQIHMGRQLSMQQYLHNTHHHAQEGYGADAEGELLPRSAMLVQEGIDTGAQYVLTRDTEDLSTGKPVEAEVARGSKGQMEHKRRQMYKDGGALVDTGELHVRKVK